MSDIIGEGLIPVDACSAQLIVNTQVHEALKPLGMFYVEHIRNGEVIYSEHFKNLVTTQGKNAILDTFLGLGTAYAAIRMGLISAAAVAGDTYASHGFTEITAYTGNRGTPSFSAASAGNKATSAAVAFSINGPATVAGAMIVLGAAANINTPGDTATAGAILLSGGTFAASRGVASGDTLNVSWSLGL